MFFSRRRSPSSARRYQPTLEQLEHRWTPAIPATGLTATLAGTSATYTDGNGDVVQVIVRGTAGTAIFNNGTTVDNADITDIVIHDASKDFSITFSNAGGGDDVVALGDVDTNDRPIRGIYTVTGSTPTDFELNSFIGKLSNKGSINVTKILDGLTLDSQLFSTQAINVSEDLDGEVTIKGALAGRIFASSFNASLTVNGAWTGKAIVTTWGGNVTVNGNLQGSVFAGEGLLGAWQINGNVTASARITIDDEVDNFTVTGNFNGQMSTDNEIVGLQIDKNVGSKAVITSGDDALIVVGTLNSPGIILPGATIRALGGGSLTVNVVNGDVGGSLAADEDLSLTLGKGRVAGQASILYGNNGTVQLVNGNFGGTIAGQNLDFSVNGNVASTAQITSADVTSFFVSGSFAGSLQAGFAISGGTVTVIQGAILATANLSISDFSSVTQLVFGNKLLGQLTFLGDLNTDIKVDGSVTGKSSGIFILGQVKSTITINGDLSFLSSDSLFEVASNKFFNADNTFTGILNVTGTINTVEPQGFTV